MISFLSPGLRFFHQGEFEGRRKRISPHLRRGPEEPVEVELRAFYDRLLEVLRRPIVRDGEWRLLECAPAWDGNGIHDGFIAFGWRGPAGDRLLAVVNYAPQRGQCHVRLPFESLAGRGWRLKDLLGTDVFDRGGRPRVPRIVSRRSFLGSVGLHSGSTGLITSRA